MAAPKRTRRKDARPSEIVSAALHLFAQRGYGATRLDDVAQAAGVGKGTVYLYFDTKEELFRAVVRQELIPTIDAMAAEVADHAGPSSDLLRIVAGRFLRIADTDVGGIPKLVLSEAGNFPEIARFYATEVIARGRGVFAEILRRGVQRGEFRAIESDLVMPTFIGPLLLMLLWRHSIGRHAERLFDPNAVVETHLDILLRGLAP